MGDFFIGCLMIAFVLLLCVGPCLLLDKYRDWARPGWREKLQAEIIRQQAQEAEAQRKRRRQFTIQEIAQQRIDAEVAASEADQWRRRAALAHQQRENEIQAEMDRLRKQP